MNGASRGTDADADARARSLSVERDRRRHIVVDRGDGASARCERASEREGDWTSVGPVSGRRRGRGGKASERARAGGGINRVSVGSLSPGSESER